MAPVVRPATTDDLDELLELRREVAGEGRWIGAELPPDEDGDHARHEAGWRPGPCSSPMTTGASSA